MAAIAILLVVWILASVIAFFNTVNHGNRIKLLESQVRLLLMRLNETKAEKKEATPVVEEPVITRKEEVEVVPPVIHEAITESFAEEKKSEEVTPEKEIQIPSPPPPPYYIPKPRRTNAEWEALIGGKIMNRIGALALIIGTGFFLKYAFDNNWITETMRVMIGFALGVACLFGGHYYQRKEFRIFSQGLVGAGIAILYLSAYACFNYYHLVSQAVAMVLMSAVTVVTFWQAFKYDSHVIGLFGWVGGFITPLLLSTGHANETGLFTYIVLLDVGLLLIVMRKEKWFLLEPLTFVGTVVMYVAWRMQYGDSAPVGLTVIFIVLFWCLFAAVELWRIYRKEKRIQDWHQMISIGNAVFLFLTLYDMIDPAHHSLMGSVTMLIACAYLGIYFFTKTQRKEEEQLLLRYLFSCMLLSVIASFIQFTDFQITIALSVESMVLAMLAARFKNIVVYYSSLALLAIAFMSFVKVEDAFHMEAATFQFITNMRTLSLAVMIAASATGLFFSRSVEGKFVFQIAEAFTYATIVFFFLIITLETNDYLTQLASHTTSSQSSLYDYVTIFILGIEWSLLSILLLFFGLKRKREAFINSGIIISGIAMLMCTVKALSFFNPIDLFLPFINIRAIALLLVAVCLFFEARWLERGDASKSIINMLVNGMRIALVVTGFIFLTVEVRDIFEQKITLLYSATTNMIDEKISTYKNQQQLSISAIWLFYSMLLMAIGIYRSRLNVRIASIAVFGIVIAKVFFYDLSYLDTLHRIISFIALGVILLLVSFLYQKYKHLILPVKEEKG